MTGYLPIRGLGLLAFQPLCVLLPQPGHLVLSQTHPCLPARSRLPRSPLSKESSQSGHLWSTALSACHGFTCLSLEKDGLAPSPSPICPPSLAPYIEPGTQVLIRGTAQKQLLPSSPSELQAGRTEPYLSSGHHPVPPQHHLVMGGCPQVPTNTSLPTPTSEPPFLLHRHADPVQWD